MKREHWTQLDEAGRRAWMERAFALNRKKYRTGKLKQDVVNGRFFLEGKHIIDLSSFYCALGEAINGRLGYFGAGLHAVHDCCHGGWGAAPPFTVVWRDAALSREKLDYQYLYRYAVKERESLLLYPEHALDLEFEVKYLTELAANAQQERGDTMFSYVVSSLQCADNRVIEE